MPGCPLPCPVTVLAQAAGEVRVTRKFLENFSGDQVRLQVDLLWLQVELTALCCVMCGCKLIEPTAVCCVMCG